MESILLTLTLKSDSQKDFILIEHLKKFRAGKGNQERGFEVRRLLHAGLKTQKSSSDSFEVGNQTLRQNCSIESAPIPSAISSSSNEDVVQKSNKQLTEKSVSDISEINFNALNEVSQEFGKVVAVIQTEELKKLEQKPQNLPALSPVFELVNLETIELSEFSGILASVYALQDSANLQLIENKPVNTGEIT